MGENRGWEGVLWAMWWGKYVLEHKFFVGVMCWERGGVGDVVKKLEKKLGKSLD